MTSLYQSLLNDASLGRFLLNEQEVSRFTPSEIRQTIAQLVSHDHMDLADALGAAGLSLYPDNEEILAITALLAEVQQDWGTAGQLLEQLLQVQDGRSPVATWQHWIRVLRCQVEPAAALHATEQALKIFPDDPSLQEEQRSLQELLADKLAHNAVATAQ